MNKILYFYIFGTTIPILVFIFEKNLPFEILDDLTYFANEIKIASYSGLISSGLIILFGFIILKFNLKDKKYDFLVKINSKSFLYLTIYSFFRFFNSLFIYINYKGLSRFEIQFIELNIINSLPDLLTQIINSLFPLISTIIFSAILSFDRFNQTSRNPKAKKLILIFLFILLISSSILFDLTRSSRGNITLTAASIIIAFLLTFKKRTNILSKNSIITLLLFSSISIAFLGNTYYRTYKVFQQDITINSKEVIQNIGVIKLIHDSTIAKAIGGQLITNKAINGELLLTTSFPNNFNESSYIENQTYLRDDYCKKYDCLHLFQPVYKFIKLFGYSKKGESIYTILNERFPFNSSSHLGSLFLSFNRYIAPLIYLFLLLLNIIFVRSRSPYFQFASIFNILFFSILAFTDNWLVTLYPYITIFSIQYAKFFNIKIIRLKN